jgi:hypothetical protein
MTLPFFLRILLIAREKHALLHNDPFRLLQEVLLDGSPPPLVNFFKEIAQHDSCHAWLSPLLVILTGEEETGTIL